MKRERVILSLVMVALFSFGVIGFHPAVAHAKAKVLRLVIATPEGDWPQTFRDKEMAKRFNARANGEYVIEVHAGGALAKLPEFFDSVRIGVVEMQFSNWGMFSFLDPQMGLLETPFLFNNNFAVNAACKPLHKLYDDVLQKKFNAKALAMTNTGGLGLFSQKPVKTLEDLKGLLVGSVSPSTSVLLKHLGSSPVTIVFTDIYESLQKKVVDSAAQSAHGGVVFSFPDVCKYFTAYFGMQSPAGYSINLDVWKKMPAPIQKILLEETEKACEWMNNVVVTELESKDLAVFKQKGLTTYVLPKEERARWAQKLEAYKQEQFSKFGEFGQKVKAIADELNAKHPYDGTGVF